MLKADVTNNQSHIVDTFQLGLRARYFARCERYHGVKLVWAETGHPPTIPRSGPLLWEVDVQSDLHSLCLQAASPATLSPCWLAQLQQRSFHLANMIRSNDLTQSHSKYHQVETREAVQPQKKPTFFRNITEHSRYIPHNITCTDAIGEHVFGLILPWLRLASQSTSSHHPRKRHMKIHAFPSHKNMTKATNSHGDK